MSYQHQTPDLDAIARNLSYLDLAHLTPEEAAAYEHELSAIASLNEAIRSALRTVDPPACYLTISKAVAAISSRSIFH